ncbi:MAG TPA: GNAT family N-acetyltransferase [Nitrolancea sp.]
MPDAAGIVIRGAEPEDLAAIVAIGNQRSVAAGTLGLLYQSLADGQERFRFDATHRMLVAEIDGRIAGNIGLVLYRNRRAHAGAIGMSVSEEFQGRGIGTALMAAVIDLADNWYNLRRLELEVYTDNDVAIRLYQRFGFVIEGTHHSYAYREGAFVDAYAMARLRNEPTLAVSDHSLP